MPAVILNLERDDTPERVREQQANMCLLVGKRATGWLMVEITIG